jgi:hypothetical protein
VLLAAASVSLGFKPSPVRLRLPQPPESARRSKIGFGCEAHELPLKRTVMFVSLAKLAMLESA